MSDAPDPLADTRRKGRRVAYGLFYGTVVLFIAVTTTQLSRQVMAQTEGASVADCRAGIVGLARSIEQARAASESEGAEGRPEEALARFRSALLPAWNRRDQVSAACVAAKDPALLEAFDTVERLRYAEEAVVRRDGQDLSPLRRKVRDFVRAAAPAAGKSSKDDASGAQDW